MSRDSKKIGTEVLADAFAEASVPLALVDAAGRFVYCNRSFVAQFDCGLAGFIGKKFSECFNGLPEDDFPSAVTPFWEGSVRRISNLQQPSFLMQLQAVPAERGGERFFVLRVSEIPPGVASLDRGRQQRLESLGRLAGEVAHDLNNMLTSILAHVSYLQCSLEESASRHESLDAIADGARRAASMTQQILDFARGERSSVRSVNFSMVVSAALNLIRPTLQEAIRIRFEGDAEDVFVFGDESKLSQLVMNLVVNARDALPNGGEIGLTLRRIVFAPEDAPREIPAGSYASLVIRDDGIGIPEEIRDRIFEPFFTTKDQQGTGLGLSTCFAIVQQHGGVIRVETQEGEGTSFLILLPLSAEEREGVGGKSRKGSRDHAANGDSATSDLPQLPTGSERILIVDDEEAVRMVMQRSLEHLGYCVDVAEDGSRALEIYRAEPNGFELVILDMMMPAMSGDEVFFKLKELDAGARVLLATGYTNSERAQSVLNAGGVGFIQKPFDIEELAREVRRCLDLDS